MTSQSENSVSVELGELLELLNALDVQDNHPIETFATLERLLAAGKVASVALSAEHHQSDDHTAGVPGGIADADQSSSSEKPVGEKPDWREAERPGAENRLAVHIVQGMRKSIKDRTL